MRFKRIIHFWSLCVILTMLGSAFWGDDAWGQSPLAINYTRLQMGYDTQGLQWYTSQALSASGGCPPYDWSLSGGGTLTTGGGNNETATYAIPGSNSGCTNNNSAITLTDSCRNIADIQIAVNFYTANDSVFEWAERIKCYCFEIENPSCAGYQYQSNSSYHWKKWNCFGALNYEAWWINGNVYYTSPENLCPFPSPPPCTNYCPCHEEDLNNCACWGGPSYCQYCNWGYPSVLCDVINDKRTTQDGCCPLNPLTGLPYDGPFPTSEEVGKNAGNQCPTSTGGST